MRQIGEIVKVKNVKSNGSDVQPGIITRVWDENMVNVTVFPDAASPESRTSIKIFANEEAADAYLAGCEEFGKQQAIAF